MPRARVLTVGETNVGMKRTHNEDTFMLADEDNLYVVADGMGAHAAGELASRMATETIAMHYFRSGEGDAKRWWARSSTVMTKAASSASSEA